MSRRAFVRLLGGTFATFAAGGIGLVAARPAEALVLRNGWVLRRDDLERLHIA